MWEIFIFVNPIGNRCLKTEKTIIQFTQQHKINAHFKLLRSIMFMQLMIIFCAII